MWAKNAVGEKISCAVTLNGQEISPTWDDTTKTSFTVLFENKGENKISISAADENGFVSATSGDTSIFIYPPYKFKCVDALVTNFHLPESTLVMLVASLTSREKILELYNLAVKEKYRFFSFGDAMMII